jgi:hypothetical protein
MVNATNQNLNQFSVSNAPYAVEGWWKEECDGILG